MVTYQLLLADSLEKVLPNSAPRPLDTTAPLLCLKGGYVSFQVAWRAERDSVGNGEALTFSFEGKLAKLLRVRRVGLEPVELPAYDGCDENYITKQAGMLPEILYPCHGALTFPCMADQWRSLWVDFFAGEDITPGEYPLAVLATAADGSVVARCELVLCIRPEALPTQTLYHTEWFHTDCLADYYHVPAWSEEHWRIVGNYMAAASAVGINMLLTPLFTPALDTAVGGERTTVQLLDIVRQKDEYRFDFTRLHRWIALCRTNGITELEICHLFTQWGAAAAPKVMAVEDGTERRIFGWDTPAVGGEYTRFLRLLLPQLKDFLRAEGMLEHTWFHISDEPSEENMESWNAAKESVADLLEGCRVLDALSSFEMYARGLIRKPVASEDHLQPFADAGVPGLWTYYCCGQHTDVPNRFVAMPSTRSRILGVLLYWYDLEGFLQWGFNFYNTAGSTQLIDPYRTADGFGSWPAGDPFLVYPAPDGTAYESLRAAVLREAMQDLRFLRLAQAKLGRDKVKELLCSCWQGGEFTMKHYPLDPAFFAKMMRTILISF